MASEDKNCDILFEYLRCILYEPDEAKLDIDELDEPFRKLGQGLQYLDKAVAEMKTCSAALAKGNLSELTPHPGNRNFFNHRVKDLDMNEQEIALCYCDLDGLKYVNDTFGHADDAVRAGCGSTAVGDGSKISSYWENVMEQADECMYKQKSEHKHRAGGSQERR